MSYTINSDGTVTRNPSISGSEPRKPYQDPKNNRNSSSLLGILISLIIIGGVIFAGFFVTNLTEEKTEVVSSQSLNMAGHVGQYPVTMQIQISGSVINGSYYYDRMGSNNILLLNGTYDNGEIHIIETTVEGEQTGDFRGRLSNGVFSGNYINYKGKEMAFNIYSR